MIELRGATVAQARRALAEKFRAAGIESPELDARILIGHALGLDHAGLAAAEKQALSAATASTIDTLAARRLAREPVARIVGEKEFWGLSFIVTPAVLVPRPETETVVEVALSLVNRAAPLRIIDLGTGSGAILLALLSELPHARGTGIDIAADALDVARTNARRLGLADRADFALPISPRSKARSTLSCPIRRTSRPLRLLAWPPRFAISTQAMPLMAVRTALRPLEALRRSPAISWSLRATSWLRSAPDRRAP